MLAMELGLQWELEMLKRHQNRTEKRMTLLSHSNAECLSQELQFPKVDIDTNDSDCLIKAY